jgi:hypothetical protein
MRSFIPFRLAAIVLITGAGLVLACNKNNSSSTNSDSNTLQTQSDDENRVSTELDNVAVDANTSLSSNSSVGGTSKSASRQSGSTTVLQDQVDSAGAPNDSLICDASVVIDTTVNPRTITITYNGTNCWGNRTRTGVVVVSIPQGEHWSDVGATVTVSVQNLVITRLSDNTSITLNGNKTMTNVTGGLLTDLANLQSITHTVAADSLSIKFPNGSTRYWSISKQRVFTYNNGIVMTTTGIHSDNIGNTNVAEWGSNRFGTAFESLITQAKVFRQDCDFRLVSGQNQVLRSDSLNSTITYGLDASGNPTTCPGSGNYYLEVVWSLPNGRTFPIIIPY